MLNRSRSVMTLSETENFGEHAQFVTFTSAYDDTNEVYRKVVLSSKDWQEFGQPQQITVMIEPGDKLNEVVTSD